VTPQSGETASPLESLRTRFAKASHARCEGLLRRYGHRLTVSERTAYFAQLESLRLAPEESGLMLRRRLLDRLMRGASQRRRLQRWEGLESLEVLPRGPYNDRAALEETLRRTAVCDPEWTRELLDLYARLGKLQTLCQALLPQAVKK